MKEANKFFLSPQKYIFASLVAVSFGKVELAW
jgi:hypothetical protein